MTLPHTHTHTHALRRCARPHAKDEGLLMREAVALGLFFPPEMVPAALAEADAAFAHDVPLSAERTRRPGERAAG